MYMNIFQESIDLQSTVMMATNSFKIAQFILTFMQTSS